MGKVRIKGYFEHRRTDSHDCLGNAHMPSSYQAGQVGCFLRLSNMVMASTTMNSNLKRANGCPYALKRVSCESLSHIVRLQPVHFWSQEGYLEI